MPQGTTQIFTKTLTNGTFTISATLGLYSVSIMLTTGSATVTGTSQVSTTPSTAISLVASIPLNIETRSNSAITGLQIDASSGTVLIVGQS